MRIARGRRDETASTEDLHDGRLRKGEENDIATLIERTAEEIRKESYREKSKYNSTVLIPVEARWKQPDRETGGLGVMRRRKEKSISFRKEAYAHLQSGDVKNRDGSQRTPKGNDKCRECGNRQEGGPFRDLDSVSGAPPERNESNENDANQSYSCKTVSCCCCPRLLDLEADAAENGFMVFLNAAVKCTPGDRTKKGCKFDWIEMSSHVVGSRRHVTFRGRKQEPAIPTTMTGLDKVDIDKIPLSDKKSVTDLSEAVKKLLDLGMTLKCEGNCEAPFPLIEEGVDRPMADVLNAIRKNREHVITDKKGEKGIFRRLTFIIISLAGDCHCEEEPKCNPYIIWKAYRWEVEAKLINSSGRWRLDEGAEKPNPKFVFKPERESESCYASREEYPKDYKPKEGEQALDDGLRELHESMINEKKNGRLLLIDDRGRIV